MSYLVEFKVSCQTSFGQQVFICGNLPQLGSWQPTYGIQLNTYDRIYPMWIAQHPLEVRQGQLVEFKMCILDMKGELVRWEELPSNRAFIPRHSIVIEFADSDPQIVFGNLKKKVDSQYSLTLSNVRKGTQQILGELQSDSSSNKDLFRQKEWQDDEQSMLLTEFASELVRSSTRHYPTIENCFIQEEFGSYLTHEEHFHYFVTPQPQSMPLPLSSVNQDNFRWIDEGNMAALGGVESQQVSIFHFRGWKIEELEDKVKVIMNKWKQIYKNGPKGITIVYLEDTVRRVELQKLLDLGIAVFMVKDTPIACSLLDQLVSFDYQIRPFECDQYLLTCSSRPHLKVLISSFQDHPLGADLLQQLTCPILSSFLFPFSDREFKTAISDHLFMPQPYNTRYLIIIHLNHIDDLQSHVISQLVYLPSRRSKVTLFVVTRERFPKNMGVRVPVTNTSAIFLNMQGEVYANSSEGMSVFQYLQIDKGKAMENMKEVVDLLGSSVTCTRDKNSTSVKVAYPAGSMAIALKERTHQLIKEVNKRSIAKLALKEETGMTHIIPFCVNLNFLYSVILRTFSFRLRSHHRGLVLAIDGPNLSSSTFLQSAPECDPQLRLLRLQLCTQMAPYHDCTQINELQLRRLVSCLTSVTEDGMYRSSHVLNPIRNIR